MSELEQLYTDAIAACDAQRGKRNITKATPNELHVYNIFTIAKQRLLEQLACIQDAQGNYNIEGGR